MPSGPPQAWVKRASATSGKSSVSVWRSERVHGRLVVEGRAHGRAEVVRRPPAAEGDAVVGRALPVDDHVAMVGEGRPTLQSGP